MSPPNTYGISKKCELCHYSLPEGFCNYLNAAYPDAPPVDPLLCNDFRRVGRGCGPAGLLWLAKK